MLLASLTNRIFLAAALLVVLATGFTAVFVSSRVTAQAESELQRGLVESGAVVGRQGEALVETISLLARLIADLPKLKAAVATGDPPTVQPLAAEYQQMLARSSLVVVTDRDARVLALAGPVVLDPGVSSTLPSIRIALRGTTASTFRPHPDGLLQVLSVPITIGGEPEGIAGTLSVGFLLDRAVAADFKQLTGSDVAFGLDGRIRASTLRRPDWAAFDAASAMGRMARVSAGGDDYVLLSAPFMRAPGARAGGRDSVAVEGSPFVMVVRSRSEQLRFLGHIQAVIGAAALVTILLATVLSYGVARTVTRPLASITDVMRDVAATGDLTRKIPVQPGSWDDEDARLLASTFNSLTDSVARFEKEAAQRERLSSLGRLSSVVAHEIRNPLMIIKAAVRTLRQTEANPDAKLEAFQDIEQEVVRLNRIVSEVLDYAKPVTFAWHDVDPNSVCREAAQAVRSAEPGVVIETMLAPDLPLIRTDGERLRTVLVNVLTNACQAVHAARSSSPDPPPGDRPGVEVHTAPGEGGETIILVRDQGGGIDAGVVARVFEPYFTTRRAGTGLGLAIARNIIDGLGGTIAMASRPSSGTDVRITLPPRPPASEAAPITGSPS